VKEKPEFAAALAARAAAALAARAAALLAARYSPAQIAAALAEAYRSPTAC
jgi:hypothetical protein